MSTATSPNSAFLLINTKLWKDEMCGWPEQSVQTGLSATACPAPPADTGFAAGQVPS